jgi:UrcA family protein
MVSTSATLRNYWRRSAALTTLTACFVVGALGTAHAGAPAASVKVKYGDLNLATAAGNNALYARIESAAREVCGAGAVPTKDLSTLAFARSCEARAVAQAVREVRSPALAAIHSERVRHG